MSPAAIARASRPTASDLTLALNYFAAASISLIATRVHGDISYWWLGTALLLPRLARLRPHRWAMPVAGCGLAATLAFSLFSVGLPMALPFALIVIAEAALGAVLLQRYLPDGRYFDTVPRVIWFVLLIGGVAPLASALAGAIVANLAYGLPFWFLLRTFFAVHALGTVTFMPIVALLLEKPGRRRLEHFDPRRGGGTNLALALAVAAVSLLVFGQSRMPLLFLPMLPLTLLVFRAGRRGAALGVCILAVVGGLLTLLGIGPADSFSPNRAAAALFFQVYLAITVATILPMAAELNRRKFLTNRLADSEAMFRLMADRSGDVLFDLDVAGRIRYCSPSVLRFSGLEASTLVGKSTMRLIAEEDRIVAAAVHGRALARPDETFVFEYRALTKGDTLTWFESHTRAIVDSHGKVTGVISAARDISHRKRAEAKLVDTANTDALTGLSNRRRFDELLLTTIRSPEYRSPAGCLAIIDIDFFKHVNDSYGHLAGDDVLKAVARQLQPLLRAGDVIARIGGEEFGLILFGLQLADADKLCCRLREHIAALLVTTSGHTIGVTVSIGIADLDAHKAIPSLMAAADAALYRAKAAGRNCVRLAA